MTAKMRLDAEADAKVRIAEFFEKNRAEFIALVQTYADSEASDLLMSLREKFWAVLP